ncbi:MAG: class I SAM-dependent methyltransferase [Candidatus Methanospirareceae archaeon]
MELLANEVELVTKLCERIKREREKIKPKGRSLKILDIGCGTGRLAVYLSRETGCAVTGIDPVRTKVEKARMKSPSLRFEVQSAEEMTFPNNTFDFAVSLKALHEIPDPKRALKEARRVLKEAGRIFIIDWIGGVPQTSGHAHAKKYFTPERLKEALLEAGFVNISIETDKERGLMLGDGEKITLIREKL